MRGRPLSRSWALGLSGLLLASLLLSACAPMAPAPVEDREGRRATVAAPSERHAEPRRGVPALHTVQRGDTLYSIAFRYGLDWRDVAAWNRISEPYVIRPGQDLRLIAPLAVAQVDTPPVAERRPEPVLPPVEAPPPAPVRAPSPSQAPPASQAPPPAQVPAQTSAPAPAPIPAPPPVAVPAPTPAPPVTAPPPPVQTSGPTRAVAGVTWRWPTEGRVVRPFDAAATRRGIGIGGRVGQPVLAAADGQVVYSGTALIGYGELIIIKHSDTMLSAYGHNRVRLVEEGASVRAGQQIAEMGISDRNEELLHFEIRRNGQPENPLNFLPPR